MYPLGHNVSEMSSTGIMRGCDEDEWDENVRLVFREEAFMTLLKPVVLNDWNIVELKRNAVS